MHDVLDDRRPWIHAICVWCFRDRQANAGLSVRLPLRREPSDATCCWCRRSTGIGLYVHDDPADVPCGGLPTQADRHP